jgi:glutamyl-tRNA synthetase
LDAEGQKFSKRLGSLSVQNLRDDGYVPQAITAYMASLGTSDAPLINATIQQLAEHFDLTTIGRGMVRFDEEQLLRVNAQCLHNMDWQQALPYVQGCNALPEDAYSRQRIEIFWTLFRENISKLTELRTYYDVVFGEVTGTVAAEDTAFIQQAAAELPSGDYTPETWQLWTSILKEKTGRKGKALFMPLRRALTGQDHGPDMSLLRPVLGEDTARARLETAQNRC